jgi:hypothetical protein
VEDFEEKFIKPIVSASYPATLAALSLTAMVVSNIGGSPPFYLKLGLLMAAVTFLFSSFSIFFYRLYPSNRKLWTAASVLYVSGLLCLITSVLILLAFTIIHQIA